MDYLVYNGCLGIILLLISIGKRCNSEFPIRFSYLLLLVLGVIRYDIGNDYENYYELFERVSDTISFDLLPLFLGVEPYALAACTVFRNFSDPAVWVFGSYWVFSVILLYKINRDNDSHFWGVCTFFIYGIIFFLFDGVRQGLAIMIVLYGYRYIGRSRWKLALMVFLAFLVHYSALVMALGYWLLTIKPRKILWITVILVFAAGYFLHVWETFRDIAFNYIPFYAGKYSENDNQMATVAVSSGLGIILRSASSVLMIYLLPDRNKVLINALFFGTVIALFANGNFNIERIGLYFLYSVIMALPILLRSSRSVQLAGLIVFCYFVIFEKTLSHEPRGNTPYKTIFSDDFKNRQFRSRD